MSKNRRSLLNLILESGVQGRLLYLVLFVLLITALPFIWGMVMIIQGVAQTACGGGGDCSLPLVSEVVSSTFLTVAGVWLILAVVCFFFAILQSHRIAGPAQTIERGLDRLLENDFSTPVVLRKNDELQSVAQRIELLRKRLAEKK